MTDTPIRKLRQMLRQETNFEKIWEYFVMEVVTETAIPGEPLTNAEDPLFDLLRPIFGNILERNEIRVGSPAIFQVSLRRVAAEGFVWGSVLVDDVPFGMIYFEDTGGLVCALINPLQFVRFRKGPVLPPEPKQ